MISGLLISRVFIVLPRRILLILGLEHILQPDVSDQERDPTHDAEEQGKDAPYEQPVAGLAEPSLVHGREHGAGHHGIEQQVDQCGYDRVNSYGILTSHHAGDPGDEQDRGHEQQGHLPPECGLPSLRCRQAATPARRSLLDTE